MTWSDHEAFKTNVREIWNFATNDTVIWTIRRATSWRP